MKLFGLLLLAAGSVLAADGPLLFYSRSFPGSVPPYLQLTVDKDGNTEYAEEANDSNPLKFRLNAEETREVFDLASKLDHFKRPLEAPVKVAFTGDKVFRYENGAEKTQVKFNYSEDPSARLLVDWFERMAESAYHRIELERAAKYDKLGVPGALLRLQASMERKRVVALDQYLPILDRIAKNETYMHTARTRAAEIADMIRNPRP